jgi:tetratricopeptide (TPR) repeat protein
MHSEFLSAAPGIEPPAAAGLDEAYVPPSGHLLRPYLDLSPIRDPDRHPAHCLGIEAAFAAALDPDGPARPHQTHPPARLRQTLIAEIGLPAYDVAVPGDLPTELRTDRWQAVVELAERFGALSRRRQARLATLFDSVGLYSATARLVPEQDDDAIRADRDAAVLALRRAHAQRNVAPSDAEANRRNVELLEQVAEQGPGPYTRLPAAITLVVMASQARSRDVARAEHFRGLAESLYDALDPDGGYPDVLYASTFWRAVSFLPFIHRDAERTTAELDLAEHHARAFVPADLPQETAWRQNLHTVLETRTKEALACGDLDLALRRARELTELDPADPKVHMELGDVHLSRDELVEALAAYRRAAQLGAPYTAFAHFMAGHCLELLGDRRGAALAWAGALRADPGSFSGRSRLGALDPGDDALLRRVGEWAEDDVRRIRAALREAA